MNVTLRRPAHALQRDAYRQWADMQALACKAPCQPACAASLTYTLTGILSHAWCANTCAPSQVPLHQILGMKGALAWNLPLSARSPCSVSPHTQTVDSCYAFEVLP